MEKQKKNDQTAGSDVCVCFVYFYESVLSKTTNKKKDQAPNNTSLIERIYLYIQPLLPLLF